MDEEVYIHVLRLRLIEKETMANDHKAQLRIAKRLTDEINGNPTIGGGAIIDGAEERSRTRQKVRRLKPKSLFRFIELIFDPLLEAKYYEVIVV